ncbi:MAG TPA: YidC/Oxa1 family membrane protein insertase [Patescibacteria group bacterium]|nr:YidC/Oxa1 family membrane protein insertase [Patescibacteria group bacterium]
MNFITHYFRDFLTYPLINLMVFAYHYIPDVGLVIILLTVIIRLLLLPSFHKSLKHQRALQKLQPKMDEIKEKYKDDKEAQSKAIMELYSIHKVNPLSSCLPLIIQIPILIALYEVFIQSLNGKPLQGLYHFVPNPGQINPMFLHWINLGSHNIYMAIIAAVSQYFLGRMQQPTRSKDPMANMMRTQMLYLFPAVTLFIGFRLPAGLVLYWIVTTLFGLGQQYYILRKEAREALHEV